ncbi:hypothetical protein SARC_05497 [Sphaeroforma arctica JP610]|uniref:BZIP domain-containing protein n=1 Tax=Sphaeroforma arctica JP610 TaxID=667725 RepID=A0A0L0G027_9EUKA|nr:hypothetical protein SARC_05497 [Sphaeroforma arctica JP610]KNC82199.1 hypothetical protein SARC_05497 [Sphaeroforma arctica JP610]|eukprot:XP_014156101.1 hypothetical protein SARC_05497 [Sphaeroforma arctica JP610]
MSTLEDFDLGLLDLPVLPGTADGSGASTPSLFSGNNMSPTGHVDYNASPVGFLDWSSPVGTSSQFLLDLCVSNIPPPAPIAGADDGLYPSTTALECEDFLGLMPVPIGLPQALTSDALFASTNNLLMGSSSALSSTSSISSLSSPDNLHNTGSGIKREISMISEDGTEGESSVSSGEEVTKKPARKHKKPRISELSEADATAKRQSNRESARKSRARKRERLDNVYVENETLKKENMELRLRLQMLMTSMIISQSSTVTTANTVGELM